MPKSTDNKNTNAVSSTRKETTQTAVVTNKIDSESKLKTEYEVRLEELENKLSSLLDLVSNTLTAKESTPPKNIETSFVEAEEDSSIEPEMPSPNKQIRIMSLCHGSLNLSEEEGGRTKIKFSKYGEVKPVLYSALINIVNTNRSFAEEGKFYILDKAAVYHLGLNEDYKRIVTKDILDNICSYSEADINAIVSNMVQGQKDTLIANLCDKVYNGSIKDLNKVNFIEKICNVSILDKVKEMQRFSELAGK